MRAIGMAGAVLLVGGVTGCVVPPPPPVVFAPPASQAPAFQTLAPQEQAPLVAVPGPGKSEAAFRADDQACRADVARLPQQTAAQPTPEQLRAAQEAGADPNVQPVPVGALPPGPTYLRCMTSRGDQVQPLQQQAEVVPAYGYLPAYPVYAGIGYGYPFFYDDLFLLRFYGGYGYRGYGFGRFGYGGYGYRGGYGFGGYRGGYGDGGYRGGFGHRGGFGEYGGRFGGGGRR